MLALASVRNITITARLHEAQTSTDIRSLPPGSEIGRSPGPFFFIASYTTPARKLLLKHQHQSRLSLVEEAARRRAQAVHAAVMAILVLFVVFLGIVFGQGAHNGA